EASVRKTSQEIRSPYYKPLHLCMGFPPAPFPLPPASSGPVIKKFSTIHKSKSQNLKSEIQLQ
ncbi:MAG: hypothetical protein PUP92_24075, partial [Rhizonema sp. PD38]|nr:hypothetical protein [Rhizonema sp. PD38]